MTWTNLLFCGTHTSTESVQLSFCIFFSALYAQVWDFIFAFFQFAYVHKVYVSNGNGLVDARWFSFGYCLSDVVLFVLKVNLENVWKMNFNVRRNATALVSSTDFCVLWFVFVLEPFHILLLFTVITIMHCSILLCTISIYIYIYIILI